MVRASKVSQQKSPAEFFAENKTIAGFDTPAKSLYTSVRELVENSLDAAERVGVLPDVSVTLEEISLERFQKVSACSHARSSRFVLLKNICCTDFPLYTIKPGL